MVNLGSAFRWFIFYNCITVQGAKKNSKVLFTFREIISGCCENYRRDMSVFAVWVKYRGFICYSGCDIQLALGFIP